MASEVTHSRLLLVEGLDEVNFFDALLKHLELLDIQVEQYNGKTKFQTQIKAFKKWSDFERVEKIGIVRDCDGNRKGAFDSICNGLRGAALPAPENPAVFSDGYPRTIVMIMPPQTMGTDYMLEDLCLEAVAGDPAMQCVTNYFSCLAKQEITHEEHLIAKARIHVFLASRERPDLARLGLAAQKDIYPGVIQHLIWSRTSCNSLRQVNAGCDFDAPPF